MGKVGRPTVMTKETLNKLEEIFALGGTDLEACFYAGISRQTLYDYQKENPEFIDRKEGLKSKPILKARRTIIDSLDDPKNSQWYLERKSKDEFSTKQIIDDNRNDNTIEELKKLNEKFIK